MTIPNNTEFVDLRFEQNANWDLLITPDGDLSFTDGLDTAFALTFFTNQRASQSEVSAPEYRQGWWGNLFSINNLEIGSKIWLLYQAVNSQKTLLQAIDYAQKSYQWLIDFNYADNVEVSATQTRDNISLTITLIKNNNVITQRVFDLWQNTVNIANGNL